MSQANKTIARRYCNEILNGGSQEAIAELIGSDFTFTSTAYAQPAPGATGFGKFILMLREAFPDFYYKIETLVAEGDRVAIRGIMQGTHQGTLQTVMGEVPGTGRSVLTSGVTWLHIADGKIQSVFVDEDAMGLLIQLGVVPMGEASAAVPSPSENKTAVDRYFSEIMSQGNLATIDELMSDDFVIRISSLHEPFRGREGMKQFVSGLRTAFPDIQFTVENQIAEGNQVACSFTSVSTHQAEFAGIPATGKQVLDRGTDIFTFANGKIAEVLVSENALGLMQQLGVVPESI